MDGSTTRLRIVMRWAAVPLVILISTSVTACLMSLVAMDGWSVGWAEVGALTVFPLGLFLSASLIAALGFIWDAKQVVVEEMLTVLNTFKKEKGHCEVPIQNSPYAQLGLWLQFQRQSFKNGTLDPLRKERLEEAGFLLEKP